MDPPQKYWTPSFIKMSPPVHAQQRKTVSPIAASENLAKLEGLIRLRVQKILDGLPRNDTFNWVDRVSIELTTKCWPRCSTFHFKIDGC